MKRNKITRKKSLDYRLGFQKGLKQNEQMVEQVNQLRSQFAIFNQHIEERWQMGAIPDWATLKSFLASVNSILTGQELIGEKPIDREASL